MQQAIDILDEMIHGIELLKVENITAKAIMEIKKDALQLARCNIIALGDGWILMSEKTPSEWGEYIVYCRVDGMTTREWDSDQDIWIHGDRESLYALEEITHWKPLGPLPITP